MALWIGVDDTDSLRGMCTTFLATEIVRDLTRDHDLIGYPRIVRLNPNIPWKTRGNGAIAIAVGRGAGAPFPIGMVNGREIRAYPRGRSLEDPRAVLERVSYLVERWSDLEAHGTDPGLVVLSRKPGPGLYWKAVREIVSLEEALRRTKGLGEVRVWKTGRGLIGASAACAWRPRDRTWEVLAYRAKSRWGTRRRLDPESVRAMDRRFSGTFNNYDYENDRIVIAPRTPCPVLFGIRGDRPRELLRARAVVRGEAPERWLVFLTNQGTDDHVAPRGRPVPRSSGRFSGRVSRAPRTIPGGHVVLGLGGLDVTAYEPSKQFREVVRALAPGDRIEVVASVREEPRTLNLEKLHVIDLVEILRKRSNPVCPDCGTRTKSAGEGGPFRCRRCRRLVPRSCAKFEVVPRDVRPGWYEPPVGSRRHLSMPLKRAQ